MPMQPDQITVLCLDDNRPFLGQAFLLLEQLGFSISTFEQVEPFVAASIRASAPLVLFVDHDLGIEGTGYDAVRAARSARADGLLLPIVYLTGRESPENYLQQQALDPYGTPSMYLAKRSLGATDLDEIVMGLVAQYEAAVRLADAQALRRAADAFVGLTDEDLDRLT